MGVRCGYQVVNTAIMEIDLTDDSGEILHINDTQNPQALRKRFTARLAKLLDADVSVVETKDEHSIVVRVSRAGHCRLELDDEVRQLIDAIEYSLSGIAKHSHGMYIPTFENRH